MATEMATETTTKFKPEFSRSKYRSSAEMNFLNQYPLINLSPIFKPEAQVACWRLTTYRKVLELNEFRGHNQRTFRSVRLTSAELSGDTPMSKSPELNWPSLNPSPTVPVEGNDGRHKIKLTPLARRLLSTTPDQERKLLHELLSVIETSITESDLSTALTLHNHSFDVLRDLAKRGFVTMPEQYGISDANTTGRWGMAAPIHSPSDIVESMNDKTHPYAVNPSTQAISGVENKEAITFTPIPLNQMVDEQRFLEEGDAIRSGVVSRQRMMRTPPLPDEALSVVAEKLMQTLPSDLSVPHLAKKYPRVLNRVADAWAQPERCREVLNDLLLDERGGRLGFPFEIMRELTGLQEYYDTMVYPTGGALWERKDFFKK